MAFHALKTHPIPPLPQKALMTGIDYLEALLSLLLVLGIIIGIAWLVKRGGGMAGLRFQAAGRKGRRLKVIETLGLDNRHRLVLISCDDREHLLLLGQQSALEIGDDARSREGIGA